jgi:hypothetical protein
MAFVYDAIDGVGKKLREINPDPHFKQNHHQWLRDFGRNKVHDQLQRVVTIMKLCLPARGGGSDRGASAGTCRECYFDLNVRAS